MELNRPGYVKKEIEPVIEKAENVRDIRKEYDEKVQLLKELDAELEKLKKDQNRESRGVPVEDWINQMSQEYLDRINKKIEETKQAIQGLVSKH